VQALVREHGVAAARLKSFGNGPFAPVASNDAEEGRTKNRRVEPAKQ
jgi:OmpA-OmpF porin, OOP family